MNLPLMNDYLMEAQRSRERRWSIAKRSSFIAPFVIGAAFCLYFWTELNFSFSPEKFTFSLSTCAVALILASTYFFTYKFFKENFYFFIFAGWLANAIYLMPDLNGPSICSPRYTSYKIGIFILSTTSTAFHLLTLFTRANAKTSQPTWRIVSKSTWIVILTTAAIYLGIAYAAVAYLPRREAILQSLPEKIIEEIKAKKCLAENIFPQDVHITLARWMMVPGSALSFILLCLVGASLKTRLHDNAPGWKGRILSDSFYLYAALQFAYPFTPYLMTQGEHSVLFLFLTAQIAKVGNAFAMLSVLQSAISYREMETDKKIKDAEQEVHLKELEMKTQQVEFHRKRQLIDLGLIASTIKHDVNTPLTTMGFDIGVLKNRYQNDPGIIKKLESLEESMERIYAIVKVVDFFRGDKEFYDRVEFMKKASILEVVHRAVRSMKNEREELKQSNSKNFIKVEGREVWVRAYSPMLEQVIVNIIKNGLEAIDEAGRERGLINISVGSIEIPKSEYSRWDGCSRWVKVEIEDNGIGIPEENMEKLTTVFTTRGDKKPNSGIGLFVGKKILDIHNGRIKFESKVGEGTRVTLFFPEWNALQKAEQQQHTSEGTTATEHGSSAQEGSQDEESATEVTNSELTDTTKHQGESA